MESVGFKEWAIVCAALGRGEQSLILRKGGIAEGQKGFGFEHDQFFLFPTYFHEQLEKTRPRPEMLPSAPDGEIEIKFFAKLEFAAFLTSWERVVALEPFHIWKRDVVRERFEYEEAPGIHAAFLRVFRLQPSWKFPDAPRFGGCRSWLELPALPNETKLAPVLSDAEHAQRLQEIRRVLPP